MNKIKKIIFILLCFLLVFFVLGKIAKLLYPVEHEEFVSKYSEKFDISNNLVYAVIKAESNFKHEAESGKNASGLMQIMAPTGSWIADKLGIQNFSRELLYVPEINIEMGCYYLSYLLDMYDGDRKCALAAYNAGYSNVDSWLLNKKYSKDGKTLEVIPFPETEKYVNQVLKNEQIYKFLYKN